MAKKNEIVGIFKEKENLDKAIAELEVLDFDRHQINVLGSNKEMKKIYGSSSIAPKIIHDDPNAPKDAPLTPTERTIGSTATVGISTYIGGCLGAMIGYNSIEFSSIAGIIFGALIGAGVATSITYFLTTKHLKKIRKQIDSGGIPLWVQTTDKNKQGTAVNVMRKYGAYDVHANRTILKEA